MYHFRSITRGGLGLLAVACLAQAASPAQKEVLTGQAAFTDYRSEKPGIRHKLTVADLPKPFATESAGNGPTVVRAS